MSWLDAFKKIISTVQSAGMPAPQRPTLNFIGATVVDNPSNNSTDVTVGGGWVAGGPLLWSPVDMVASVVAAGVETLVVTNEGSPGGDNYGCSFYAYRTGRSCSGVRFYWGSGAPSGLIIRCALWANVLQSDGGSRTAPVAATVDIVIGGAGIYVARFSAPVPLVPGSCYVVSARETTGQYSSLIDGDGNFWPGFFGPSGAGAPQFAPTVFGNVVPGVTALNNPTQLIGGGGGSPADFCPSQSTATYYGLEPVLT